MFPLLVTSLLPPLLWLGDRRLHHPSPKSVWLALFAVILIWCPAILWRDGYIDFSGRLNVAAASFLFGSGVVFVVQRIMKAIETRRRERQILRIQRGLCFACGYSLRGNVSGVCPECGMRMVPPGHIPL